MIRCFLFFLISLKSTVRLLQDSWMGADVCRTSSRASRRPPDVISTAAILNPRWRRRKWRHPGPGAGFSIPVVEGGGKWRPFRFRSPSWVTSFAGTGNEVIQDGDRKRKGRHFPPPSTMGIEKPALYYCHTGQKIADFDLNSAFPDCHSSLNSPMDLKWRTELGVVQRMWSNFFEVIHQISRSHVLKNRRFESNFSKIMRPVAAIKSLRFALLQKILIFLNVAKIY